MNELMRQLQCPMCETYMVPPIYICEKGHNICSNCRPKLEECPTCGQQLLDSRNVALENLARNMHYPCMYQVLGCVEMLPMDLITGHEVMCPHRPHICPLSKVPKVMCPWEGSRTEVQGHVNETHDFYVDKGLVKGASKGVLSEVCEDFKHFKVMQFMGEAFLRQIEVRDGVFYCVLLYVGPEELASEYKYEFRLSKGNQMILVRNVACSNEKDLDSVFNSDKCVALHYRVVKNFMTENGDLPFEVKIFVEENKCCAIM